MHTKFLDVTKREISDLCRSLCRYTVRLVKRMGLRRTEYIGGIGGPDRESDIALRWMSVRLAVRIGRGVDRTGPPSYQKLVTFHNIYYCFIINMV
jgi:hypothetical protein